MFLYQINTQQKGKALILSVLKSLKYMSPLMNICVNFQIRWKLINTCYISLQNLTALI